MLAGNHSHRTPIRLTTGLLDPVTTTSSKNFPTLLKDGFSACQHSSGGDIQVLEQSHQVLSMQQAEADKCPAHKRDRNKKGVKQKVGKQKNHTYNAERLGRDFEYRGWKQHQQQ